MPLSKEEKAQLDALTAKSKEPEGPPQGVNFTLDLSSDTAWERAQQLGIVPKPEAAPEDPPEEGDDPPRRRGGGERFFGQG